LLKKKRRYGSEDLHFSSYGFKHMNDAGNAAYDPIHGFIRQEERDERNPVFHETPTAPVVCSIDQEKQNQEFWPRIHLIYQTKNNKNCRIDSGKRNYQSPRRTIIEFPPLARLNSAFPLHRIIKPLIRADARFV
jgi:hypothetical protein